MITDYVSVEDPYIFPLIWEVCTNIFVMVPISP
jgi:hypothetical protein